MPDHEPDPDEQSVVDSADDRDAPLDPPDPNSTDTAPDSNDGAGDAPAPSNVDPTNDASDHSPAVNELAFEGENLAEKLRQANDEQLNEAPFGIIRVDDDGVIEFFNRYESELSGITPEEAKGRNFFTQVAPCTNNRLFRGRFKKGVRRGELDETFTYTYIYKMRPTLVDVHLYRDDAGHNWITVQKY